MPEFYGIGGKEYPNFQVAWDEYYSFAHGSDPLDAETYHVERKAFFSGAISAINVLSVRINELSDKSVSVQHQVGTAIMSTLNEAMQSASEEFGK